MAHLDIGTIYIHKRKFYTYEYPQDSSIAFSRAALPFKKGINEFVIFSFSKQVDPISPPTIPQEVTYYKVKEGVYYYSW